MHANTTCQRPGSAAPDCPAATTELRLAALERQVAALAEQLQCCESRDLHFAADLLVLRQDFDASGFVARHAEDIAKVCQETRRSRPAGPARPGHLRGLPGGIA